MTKHYASKGNEYQVAGKSGDHFELQTGVKGKPPYMTELFPALEMILSAMVKFQPLKYWRKIETEKNENVE